ncbi:hypothetical protein B0H16DRAFT_1481961 [Mycena metata]|uniref:Uncharacterized protein n=1 Tax=Mycena metata TaxID=1033252 RepID=A0AAD7M970_9AGAR|nr:hypothetical protein B0H16DRAFT_1481961 [Mycena metata]
MSSQFAIRRQDLAAATAPFEVLFLAMPSDLSGPRIFGLIDRKCQLYRRQIIDLPLVALNEQKSQIPRLAQLLAYHRGYVAGGFECVESPFWEMQRKLLSFEGREVTYLRNQNIKMKLKVVVPPMT